jgi:signal transduction histidine kinase
MADLELENGSDGEHAAAWKAVMKSADAIECIANDVLEVRRMQEGRLECHVAEVDVEALFADLGHAVQPLLQPGVRFAATVDPVAAQVTLRSDARRLRQILLNFLTNAAKFTERGSVALDFAVVGPAAGRFTVRDTGRGIPEQKQEVLFRQFQQVEDEDANSGFGLGLYLCRMLAKLLDVELGFRSVAGEGAEFWLTMRLEARVWGDFEIATQF